MRACDAAVAVRLARGRNRDDAMEEQLFSNQPAMTPDSVRQWARDVGQVTDFEATYSSYGEFQDRMEHYWCLRWLLQERVAETPASVIRDGLVRLARLPLVVRLADLPGLAPETQVRVAIGRVDLVAATLEARYAGEERE